MTNKDFGIAANKLMYLMYNFPCELMDVRTFNGVERKQLPSFFEVFDLSLRNHLMGKWNANYKSFGAYGVFPSFYGELDNKNRAKVMKWINENFSHRDDFGISIAELESE